MSSRILTAKRLKAYGTGLAAGQPGGGNVSVGITSADLSHTYSISTGLFATGGDVVGATLEKGMTYYPYSLRAPQAYTEGRLGLAAELAGGGMANVSGPIWVWNRQQYVNYSLPTPQMVSSVNSPINNQAQYSQSSGVTLERHRREIQGHSTRYLAPFKACSDS